MNRAVRPSAADPRSLAACLVAMLCLLVGRPAFAAPALPDFTRLVESNSPAVVNISTSEAMIQEGAPGMPPDGAPEFGIPNLPEDSPLNDFFRRFFGDQMPDGPGAGPLPRSSLGSGFIVSKDGYVISNYHVVKDADEIVVRLSDRRELQAEVVGTDPRSDIAVLKVAADSDLPVLRLGSADRLKVGEWVLAIGSPFGFDHSVTAGIVSAKGRSLPNENYVPFIQTDVAINPGNSGGPLFNLDGEVVGVNSQIYSRTGGFMGLSFAIPIDVVMNVYQQIRERGSVSRGWLGVLIQDVTSELAESFRMDKPHGALVSKVLPESPAAEAGVEPGDVIVSFKGTSIDASSDLPPMVGSTTVGEKIEVELIRGGKPRTVIITIGELPDEAELAATEEVPAAPGTANSRLGVTARELSAQERQELEVGDRGVMVERVEPGPGADAGLEAGDVILQINFKEIKSVADLTAAVEALPAGGKVPLLVQRQGGPLFLALEVPSE